LCTSSSLSSYKIFCLADVIVTPSFVCAASIHYVNAPSGPTRLRTYIPERNRTEDCKIWQAGRATSAAPGLFSEISIGREGQEMTFIDGAIGANNPVKELVDEVTELYGAERKIGCVVSIGTGVADVIGYSPSGFREMLFHEKLLKALGKLTTDSERVAEEMEKRYRDADPTIYWRLNVNRGLSNIQLDEWQNLRQVKAYTLEYLKSSRVTGMVDEIVAALTLPPEVSRLLYFKGLALQFNSHFRHANAEHLW
jgi:hypothetical protein